MRKTSYTPEFATAICDRLASGDTLRAICRDPGFPPESTIREWVRDDRNGFAAAYNAARALQIESWADDVIEITNRTDINPQDKRVRTDSLKWLLSKLAPKRYGDRLLVAGDEGSPVQVLHKSVSLDGCLANSSMHLNS